MKYLLVSLTLILSFGLVAHKTGYLQIPRTDDPPKQEAQEQVEEYQADIFTEEFQEQEIKTVVEESIAAEATEELGSSAHSKRESVNWRVDSSGMRYRIGYRGERINEK